MTNKGNKRTNAGPSSPPQTPPPAKENFASTPDVSNVVPDVEMSPLGKLEISTDPQAEQEPRPDLQRRIPEDQDEDFYFDMSDVIPTPPVPLSIPWVKPAGVMYTEAIRVEPPLTATNVFDLKTLAKEKFTLTSTGNRIRFNTLDMVLRTNGLASLVERDRPLPIPLPNNPFGIMPPQCIMINGEYVVLSADSIAKYQHDLLRLEVIMNTAFDKTLHHHSVGFRSTKTQKPRPILVYEDMKRYFYGQDNQGIQAARDALTNYKTNPSHSIRADLVLFTDAITTLEYASSSTLDDSICLSYLYDFFKADRRFGVKESLSSCMVHQLDYKTTLAALHNLPDAAVTPGSSHRLLAFQSRDKDTAKEKQPCHKFAAGHCPYGDKCRYAHVPVKKTVPMKALQSSTPPPPASQSKPGPRKNPLRPTYIDERHRQQLGRPRGDVSKENPTGISRKQHIVLKALQAAEQTSHGDEDWITSYRPGRDNHGNSFALNMFQSDSSHSPPITTPPLATPDKTRREDHLRYYSPTPPRSRPYQPTSPTDADVADINAYEIINLTALDEYVANLQPISEDPDLEESPSDSEPTVRTDTTLAPITLDARQLDYFMRNTRQYNAYHNYNQYQSDVSLLGMCSFCYDTQPMNPTTPATYTLRVNIFNWSPVPQFTIADRLTGQIQSGSPPLLELLVCFGQVFLRAEAFPAMSDTDLTEKTYNSFSPYQHHFNPPGSPGSYTSTMGSVADYILYYKVTLQDILSNHIARSYLLLTLI